MITRLALAFLLAACGKNDAVRAAEEMADAVCVCKDLDCAREAHERGLAQAMKHAGSRGSKADVEAIVAAGKRLEACRRELLKASP